LKIAVQKTQPNGSRAIYIGGVYEVNKNASGSVTGTTTYYSAAGAMRVVTGPNVAVYYTLGDQLGSTSVVTDASGAVMGTQGYYPFGETRYKTGNLNPPTGSPITDRLYTGQQEITGLGLYNYKARFYDPAVGRFISADSITPGGPEGLNRYSYSVNNPINFNDPSGHMVDQCGDFGCGSESGIFNSAFTPNAIPTSAAVIKPAPTATATKTPIPCGSVVSNNCGTATAVHATATVVQATKASNQCRNGEAVCIVQQNTPVPTTTPIFYNEVNSVVDSGVIGEVVPGNQVTGLVQPSSISPDVANTFSNTMNYVGQYLWGSNTWDIYSGYNAIGQSITWLLAAGEKFFPFVIYIDPNKFNPNPIYND
jgi:RHS repeat-associated protein